MTEKPWPDVFQLPPVGPYGWDAMPPSPPEPEYVWLEDDAGNLTVIPPVERSVRGNYDLEFYTRQDTKVPDVIL